ncbi:MAG TPA: choice-of-anchor tandem repeat GloVer-containing protein [Terriglobia bacterium]|nr:choice-of-anchor tandem repeat GloVer-containing protein [Terriglobia bacterium]
MTSKEQDQSCRERKSWASQMRVRVATAAMALTVVLVAAAIATPSAQAQTFHTLDSFDGTDGTISLAALVQANDGSLYGTTRGGGAFSQGAVFKITLSGTLTTVYSFCAQSNCTDGANPNVALIQATDGNLYGTTSDGGEGNGDGTVFRISPSGTLTTLYSFQGNDGAVPEAALVQGTDGNLYGTTNGGGTSTNCFGGGCGTVFKITLSGTLTTLHSFDKTDGEDVNTMIQGIDGNLYGTTYFGGATDACSTLGCGTIFKITPSGTLTTLHNFDNTDGAYPPGGLVEARDGNFYGTTSSDGANGEGGTVFEVTPSGTLTTLYNFCSQGGFCTDGYSPNAVVQATDGNFYGTTAEGGASFNGTIFKITSDGALTTLYNFCSQSGCTDGDSPEAAVTEDTNGNFYGTTSFGGTSSACDPYGCGTVFSLSVGLQPFVETQTTSGRVGSLVKILGTDLTDATSVTFNATPAVFTVVSPSFIRTTVPEGATSGTVQVTVAGRTLSSNRPFQVRP